MLNQIKGAPCLCAEGDSWQHCCTYRLAAAAAGPPTAVFSLSSRPAVHKWERRPFVVFAAPRKMTRSRWTIVFVFSCAQGISKCYLAPDGYRRLCCCVRFVHRRSPVRDSYRPVVASAPVLWSTSTALAQLSSLNISFLYTGSTINSSGSISVNCLSSPPNPVVLFLSSNIKSLCNIPNLTVDNSICKIHSFTPIYAPLSNLLNSLHPFHPVYVRPVSTALGKERAANMFSFLLTIV